MTDSKLFHHVQMNEYCNHPGMALELVIQCYLWLTCCLLYYGVNYGWSAFGGTPYVSYLFAGKKGVARAGPCLHSTSQISHILVIKLSKVTSKQRTLALSDPPTTSCSDE